MNTLIKNLCLVLSLCLASVDIMQPGEHKRADSAESLPMLFPTFPSAGSIYSAEPWDHALEVQNGIKQKPRMLILVESRNLDLQNKLNKISSPGVRILTEEPVSSFIRPQNPEPALEPSKKQLLFQLLCCCCK